MLGAQLLETGVHDRELVEVAVARAARELQLLAEVEKTFDLLYDAYFEPAKR